MIDLYYWPTPNGWKIGIALEEMALAYRVVPVNLGRAEQFEPAFLALSPNNRIPAIVDHEPLGGGAPLSIFESGAILLYLGEKTGQFLPREPRDRYEVVQWVMWQVSNLGPAAGQANHFRQYAPEPVPYATERFTWELERLYGVLDRRLAQREFVAGEYSVADMACFPWLLSYKRYGMTLDDKPHLRRWYEAMKARPAVRRGVDVGKELRDSVPDPKALVRMFGPAVQRSAKRGPGEAP